MIKFMLKRQCPDNKDLAVMGELFIDNRKICDTLEPPTGEYVNKKYGRGFCIPPGIYKIKLTHSFRFKKLLPELFNVPGRLGIRIHAGNTDRDTEGCILPGRRAQNGDPYIYNSREALGMIISLIRNADNMAEINII